jgi:pimeloyl-ACP methyl ester carboxylesterase
MLPTSLITADVFLEVISSESSRAVASAENDHDNGGGPTSSQRQQSLAQPPPPPTTVIFFITGNPGLIAYYHSFLGLLAEDRRKKEKDVVISGFSLGGFEVDIDDGREGEAPNEGDREESEQVRRRRLTRELLYPDNYTSHHSSRHGNDRLYTLAEQIQLCHARLEHLVQRLGDSTAGTDERQSDATRPNPPVKVILMGHSVGAYIALEMVRLWHESPSPLTKSDTVGWHISSCVLLTPTIVDIHVSPSGRLATPILTSIPVFSTYLPAVAQMLLNSVLLKGFPPKWLESLVQRLTGMPADSPGLSSTMAFLRSKTGVKQALFMASAEMKEIRADRWGEEVWGVMQDVVDNNRQEGGSVDANVNDKYGEAPRLFFWFAKSDHWVADRTREQVLQARAGGIAETDAKSTIEPRSSETERVHGRSKPTVLIDETDGLVHAWCLEQSEIVARRVGRWLEDILEGKDSQV